MQKTVHCALLGFSLLALASQTTAQIAVCPGGEWTVGTSHPAGTGDNRLLLVALGGEGFTDGTEVVWQ